MTAYKLVPHFKIKIMMTPGTKPNELESRKP